VTRRGWRPVSLRPGPGWPAWPPGPPPPHGSWLLGASRDAYGEGLTGLIRAGPPGTVPGLPKLAGVRCHGPAQRGGTAVLMLRWHAADGGSLFPVLDADITLSPAGEHATTLALAGAYRPPPGAVSAELDRAIVHRAATATIGSFVTRIADAIAHPAPAREPGPGTAERQVSWLRPAPGKRQG
jgi:hypothetical protein